MRPSEHTWFWIRRLFASSSSSLFRTNQCSIQFAFLGEIRVRSCEFQMNSQWMLLHLLKQSLAKFNFRPITPNATCVRMPPGCHCIASSFPPAAYCIGERWASRHYIHAQATEPYDSAAFCLNFTFISAEREFIQMSNLSNTPAMYFLECNTFYATHRNTMCIVYTVYHRRSRWNSGPWQSSPGHETGHAVHPLTGQKERERGDSFSGECLIE